MTGVVIIGGDQPLGIRLAERLRAADPAPEVLVVGTAAVGAVRLPPGARYQQVDLADATAVERLVGRDLRTGLDAVVHLAFHRHLGGRREAHRSSVDTARQLLRLAERSPTVRQFVHRSAADVYARDLGRPHLSQVTEGPRRLG